MKPQEPIPHNYSIAKLNAIFALSALFLLAVTGVMVMYDYFRGWKWFQVEFMRLQASRIEAELSAADDADMRKQLASLEQQMKVAQLDVAKNRDGLLLAQKDVEDWEGKHYA